MQRVQETQVESCWSNHGATAVCTGETSTWSIHPHFCRLWRPVHYCQGRGKQRQKCWLCLFTSLSSRAVHLEMAYGLDTDSFLRCFIRMTSRRGYLLMVISDCGTNFIRAERELCELVDNLDHTASKGVKWSFNPLLVPQLIGGLKMEDQVIESPQYFLVGNFFFLQPPQKTWWLEHFQVHFEYRLQI